MLKALQAVFGVVLFVGCLSVEKPQAKDWPQRCELCGSQWLVTPHDPSDRVEPTVEWCFNDGAYCEEGL